MNLKLFFRLNVLLLAVFSFFACSQDESINEQTVNVTGEKVNVKLTFDGDILEFGDLVTRSGEESLDLFGMMIFSSPLDEDNYTYYAEGLYDDMEEAMNFVLFTDRKYCIQATLIREGKYRIYGAHWEENGIKYHTYKEPFNRDLTNQLDYSSSGLPWEYMNGLINGYHYGIANEYWEIGDPDIDRYYGEVMDYVPASGGNDVVLSMKRVSTRLVVNVKGLRSKIVVRNFHIHGNPNGEPVQKVMIFPLHGNERYLYDSQWLSNPISDEQLKAVWHREDGTENILMDETLYLQAGKTTTIDFDLSSYYGSGPGIEIPGEEWD